MRVPISWLAEYVDVAPGTTPEDIHAALVSVGLEEEDVHTFEVTGPVVVGTVLDFTEELQSNGKTIRWCQVQVAADAHAEDAVRGIICGAGNFHQGDQVVVALPGAVLPGPFPITARKTYGHVSDGMIASARELGLGEDHDGILRLVTLGIEATPGTDAISLLGLDDAAVEVNVTPDRGYALSIRGIAREYAHATGGTFRDPAHSSGLHHVNENAPATEFPVRIVDDNPIRGRSGASVFITRSVRGIDPATPTPPWMVSRLKLAGIRSISIAVDITNYVMIELGQPIHGYDLDQLTGGITVRRAHAGETLTTLDGQVRKLSTEDLLITDESGPIGLAGVMGGSTTELSSDTRNVLVESANFDPVSVARTARRHKLPSEASRRYERGVDPQVAVAAAARVVQLLVQLAGGVADSLGSVLDESVPAEPILLPTGFVSSLIGVDFTKEEVHSSLAEIGGVLVETAAGLMVTPPSWRPDVTDKWTLAEEVARLVGYDRIPAILPVAPPGRGLTHAQRLRRRAGTVLAAGGNTEVLAYPFVSEASNTLFGSATGQPVPAVRLANPMDSEVPFMRTSLLPGLLEIARRNLARGLTDLALFEIGSVFLPEPGVEYGQTDLPAAGSLPSPEEIARLHAGIPPQPTHVSLLALGHRQVKQPGQNAEPADLIEVLDEIRRLGAAFALTIEVRQGAHHALHPGRTATLVVDTADGPQTVGVAGELLPALAEKMDLPRVVAVAELDLDRLIELASADPIVAPISSYPAATQDVTLVVDQAVPAGDVQAAVKAGAGALLEHIHLVDDYRGHGLAEDTKALTFALRFRASDRTLTAAEATESKLAGVAVATERFGATIRA